MKPFGERLRPDPTGSAVRHRRPGFLGVALAWAWTACWAATAATATPEGTGLQFTDVTTDAGLLYEHGLGSLPFTDSVVVSGGVAAGDVDNDGYTDLFVVRGGLGPTQLWRNVGDGSFEEVAADHGLALDDPWIAAPLFVDTDGDGWQDLLVGGIADAPLRLFRNRRGLDFVEVTADSGFFSTRNNFSAAAADYDRDGDLDLVVAHWSPLGGGANHLWRNDGDLFSPVDWRVGIAPLYLTTDFTFTPSFSDLDDDGWPELLMASDFGTGRVFRNELGETLALDTRSQLSDENGMGSALGDFDNDGDFDWFVTSIWDPDGTPEGNWGVTGNRLYRNRGDGAFDDVSAEAGVRQGYWGWGACFGDFDHDGWLDLFQTNGFQAPNATEFFDDPVRLFINRRDGTFEEQSALRGLDDTGLGRGVVCFDYDRDGDLDLFIANHSGSPRLYRNELNGDDGSGGASHHWLSVELQHDGPNPRGIGARLRLVAGGQSQIREIRCGSNYLSQNPSEAHFGLGEASRIDSLHVRWPDGFEETYEDIEADQHLLLRRVETPAVEIPTVTLRGVVALCLLLLTAALPRLRRLR